MSMPIGFARKLVGGTVGIATTATKHVVWYVRYHLEGITRDDDPPKRGSSR